MSKFSKIAAGLAVVPMLAIASPVFADSPGQLEGGANIYVVKNVTTNGNYGATATAGACQELKYSVRLHNTEFGKLSSIVVKATLPSSSATTNVSNMTATTAAGGTTGTSGSVTVNLSPAQVVTYEAGSTQLFDGSANLIKALPDGVATSNGVNVGDLNGSTTEFVTFKAKTTCETTPPVTPPTTPVTPTTPTVLPNTGAGDVVAVVAGAIAAGFVASRLFLSRKLAR